MSTIDFDQGGMVQWVRPLLIIVVLIKVEILLQNQPVGKRSKMNLSPTKPGLRLSFQSLVIVLYSPQRNYIRL